MKHLEIDGISWCQCTIEAKVISAANRDHVVLVCQYDDDIIDTAAEWLREHYHVNAVALDGPCQQRDIPEDYDNLPESRAAP
jgi:hypothetical protein